MNPDQVRGLWIHIYRFFFPQAEKQILFVIQTFMEITGIFENADSAPWDKNIIDDFSNIIHEQINGLQSCVSNMCDSWKYTLIYSQNVFFLFWP